MKMETKTKILANKEKMFSGYIYLDGKEIEKTPAFFSKANCIDYLNKRIRFHNAKRNVQIPLYIEEQKNA